MSDSTDVAFDVITDFEQGADVLHIGGLGFTDIQAGAGSGTVLGYTDDGIDTVISDVSGSFVIQLTGVFALTGGDFIF